MNVLVHFGMLLQSQIELRGWPSDE